MLEWSVLDKLKEKFDSVKDLGNGTVNVGCNYCDKLGMGIDGSGKSARGHLGLNFNKNCGYCVRCGYSIKNLRKWLLKSNVDAGNLDFSAGKSHNFLADEVAKDIQYIEHVLRIPDHLYPIDERDRYSWPFAETILNKYITWDQIYAARLMYATRGKLAGYVWFPFYEDDDLVYWQGRAAWEELDKNPSKRKLNPNEKEATLGKSCWLYGVDDAVVGGDAFLCEGALDRITLHDFVQREYGPSAYACSIQGVTMKMGDSQHHPLNTQLGKLACLDPKSICILFDGPKGAGDKGATAKAEALASELRQSGFNAYAGSLAHGDPNENGDDGLRAAISPPPPSNQQDMRWVNQFSNL